MRPLNDGRSVIVPGEGRTYVSSNVDYTSKSFMQAGKVVDSRRALKTSGI